MSRKEKQKRKHVATADFYVPSDRQKKPAPCPFKWSEPRVLCDVVLIWCFGEQKPYTWLIKPVEQMKRESIQTWSEQLQNSSGMVVPLDIRGYIRSNQTSF